MDLKETEFAGDGSNVLFVSNGGGEARGKECRSQCPLGVWSRGPKVTPLATATRSLSCVFVHSFTSEHDRSTGLGFSPYPSIAFTYCISSKTV